MTWTADGIPAAKLSQGNRGRLESCGLGNEERYKLVGDLPAGVSKSIYYVDVPKFGNG